MDFDFQRYIQHRHNDSGDGDEKPSGTTRAGYAFSRDYKVLKTLDRARFVEMALKATIKLEEKLLDTELLADAQPTTPEEHPKLYSALNAAALHVNASAPELCLMESPGVGAIGIFGIEEVPRLLIAPSMAQVLDQDELTFLMGRGLGHIQNGHAPYMTTTFALDRMKGAFYGWVVKPAQMAIGAWQRHGAITADRAGLLACRSLLVAVSALVKIGLSDKLDIDALLERIAGARGKEIEDLSALVEDDLQLSRRILAMRAFARSQHYHKSIGKEGGESLTSIDREVESIVKLW